MAVNRAASLVLPASMALLIDRVFARRDLSGLPPLLAAVLGATAAQALTGLVLDRTLAQSAQRLVTAMRTRAGTHLLHLPLRYFDGEKSSALAARIMRDPESLRDLLGPGALNSAGALFTGVFAAGAMLYLSPRLTLPLLALLAALAFAIRWSARDIRARYEEIAALQAALSGRLGESIAGIRVIKAYAAEARDSEAVARLSLALEGATVHVQTTQARISALSTFIFTLIGLGLLYAGTLQIVTGGLTAGRLTSYCALLAYASQAARQLGGLRLQFASAKAGFDRLASAFGERREDADPGRFPLPAASGLLQLRNVSFAYSSGAPVLQDVSFTATPGTMTALVGASGAGKSTLCALVCGFYAPTEGEVQVDGVSLSTAKLDHLRQHLGVVLQDAFLFSGTVRENVLFGRPDASEDDLRAACAFAGLDRFVPRLSAGYETLVGERGASLSGGERQRVCMARAILRNPRILLLDEPTSSLDEESEHYFHQSLEALIPGRTTVIVAHRLSTIRRADQILVLEKGRIVEKGSHAALVAQRGAYFRLFRSQPGFNVEAV